MADKQQLQARNRELAKTINNLRKQLTDTQQELRKTKQSSSSSDGDLSFRKTIIDCNNSLRKQGKVITEQFLKNPLSVKDFDINNACSMFDPYVWNTICMLTATVDELSFFRQSDVKVYEECIKFHSDRCVYAFNYGWISLEIIHVNRVNNEIKEAKKI